MKKILSTISLVLALTFFSHGLVQAQTRTVKNEYKVKRPWSHKKKDAVIGAGVGAVTGALIGHGAKGAVIGGVAGGGAGYLYGRHRDKKYGNPKYTREYVYKRKVRH